MRPIELLLAKKRLLHILQCMNASEIRENEAEIGVMLTKDPDIQALYDKAMREEKIKEVLYDLMNDESTG